MFIDDMNMPQVDLYGTQQPIALLKLLLEKGGMYDRGKDLNWKLFKDIVLVAAMGKVGTEYDINLTLACGSMTMSIDCARLMYENSVTRLHFDTKTAFSQNAFCTKNSPTTNVECTQLKWCFMGIMFHCCY